MSAQEVMFNKNGKTFPVLELKADVNSKYGFTFGASKARLILDNLAAIREFADAHRKEE